MPVSSKKCYPAPAGNPIQRAASTRSRCPCANSATSPLAPRARAITRSTRALTSSGVSPPGHPSRKITPSGSAVVDLFWGQAFVLAVIPLGEIGVDHGFIAELGQRAGFARPLHRAAEDKRKDLTGERRPHPVR